MKLKRAGRGCLYYQGYFDAHGSEPVMLIAAVSAASASAVMLVISSDSTLSACSKNASLLLGLPSMWSNLTKLSRMRSTAGWGNLSSISPDGPAIAWVVQMKGRVHIAYIAVLILHFDPLSIPWVTDWQPVQKRFRLYNMREYTILSVYYQYLNSILSLQLKFLWQFFEFASSNFSRRICNLGPQTQHIQYR